MTDDDTYGPSCPSFGFTIIPILRYTHTAILIEYTPIRHVGLVSLFNVPPSNLFTNISAVTSAGTSNFILDDEEDEEEMPELISDEHLEVHGFKRGFFSRCPLAG